ncbi:MAG TPA: hypothetical protein VJZ00_15465, partial [Thermoanaerobaculia bacterium]|nr:hypothetical protein [Thermoanaerobaculia bacterium]
ILLPFLIPYRIVSDKYNLKRPENEVRAGSGLWSDWLRANQRSRWYGNLVPEDQHRGEHEVFPGLAALFFVAAAIVMTRRRALPRSAITHEPPHSRALRALDVAIAICGMLTILGAMAEPRIRLGAFGHVIFSIRGVDVPLTAVILLTLVRLSIRMPLALGGGEGRTLRDAMRDSRFDVGAWIAMLWIAIGVLGTLGMNAFLHAFLYQRIEAYESIRAPGRWAVIAFAGMAVWIALGVEALLERRIGMRRVALACVLVLATIIDVLPVIQWEQALSEVAPVYRFVDHERIGPVLEWPVDNWLAFRYLLGSTHHRVMLMNGSSGWEGPLYRLMRIAWDEQKFADSFTLAEQNGARLLIVHEHWMKDSSKVREALRQAVDAKRIAFLRRFDHGVEGDFVFAITRNFPEWQRLRAPEAPDGAGQLPEQQLAAFLAGEPTYSNTTFGRMESPEWFVKGPLHVKGWAISPRGVKEVNVLIDSGRRRYQALRTKRPEITKRYSWYFELDSGFELVLPERPRGVSTWTDVQIELVDGAGNVTLLEDQPIRWFDAD